MNDSHFYHITRSINCREIQEKMRQTKYLREDILRLIEEQEEWKNIQKRISDEENEKIARYIADQDERAKRIKETDREKMLVQQERREEMCIRLNEIEVIDHVEWKFVCVVSKTIVFCILIAPKIR